ncbi:hypothetical protein GPECTOR_4g581 [Gonium pectorale]|uniref:Rhamnosyl O-methyltransferase n=1 Tax=Gonium pectorale TaxID=33097 RepID=A0A150GX80_GONPE|nr:hypothetical protein GPECTOR_4g581 [Gonium pectorale]|eukprot:KXZ54516.1 hypothetical protein GPECTOR_4g581 [Gonium pectorale]
MECYAPLSQRMDDPTEEKLAKLEEMMLENFNRSSSIVAFFVPGLDYDALERGDRKYRHQVLRRPSADPRYWRWLRLMSNAVLRYTGARPDPVTKEYLMGCPNPAVSALVGKVTQLKGVDCTNASSIVDHMGFFNDASLKLDTIIKRVIRDPGWCSVRPMYEPYGLWLKRERMMSRRPGDQRFRFDNRHKDRVVFLFDILYESEYAFKKQHWLGAAVQQNPFDMYAIMDIIHNVQPDLVVETGTANGGSALMWASMMELTRPGSGRVVTVDVNEPKFAENWGGKSAKDPTNHTLWSKYVTFIKGSTLDGKVLETVRSAASAAKSVVVLLDSDHTEHHVELEAKAYCPLVSEGSYCIVQDTKLSRFSAVGGPAPGIKRFLESTKDFVIDRDREPFYTQHVGGYLKRVAPGAGGAAAGAASRRRLPDAAVPINLYELMGPDAYARGVIWQPMECFPPLSEVVVGDASGAAKAARQANVDRLEAMLLQDLRQALSEVAGVELKAVDRNSSIVDFLSPAGAAAADAVPVESGGRGYRHRALRRPSGDPRYWAWLRRMSVVALSYTAYARDSGSGTASMACLNDTIAGLVGSVGQVPGVDCTNASSVLQHMGLFTDAAVRLDTLIQRVIRDPGWCSVWPVYEPYGVWLKRERMMSRRPGDQRFRFDNRHKDRVVFLFDILYESEYAFKKQHWLGAAVQQNPFDMYAIMDIIHNVQPDLVVETGTANGGSALMWASMMELTRPGSGRVVTVDVNEPKFAESWGGQSSKDPTNHTLWSKYVTFIKGSTLDGKVLETVRSAASAAKSVVVLLDSDHTEHHVELEAKAYCPLVSEGSYCIVQDTKLSRFSAVGGPATAIQRFLESTNEFVVDRDREPFYTQHPMACHDPVSKVGEHHTEARLVELEEMLTRVLTPASSFPSALGISGLSQALLATSPRYARAALRRLSGDPRYWSWMRELSAVVLRYTPIKEELSGGHIWRTVCASDRTRELLRTRSYPLEGLDCDSASSVVAAGGLFPDAELPVATVARRVIRETGWCSMHPQYDPYGVWLKKERILKRQRADGPDADTKDQRVQRFRFDNPHKDRVVFLFDLLYESEHAFKNQHWLGSVSQQNPFDMYAIMDIIHNVQPDLVVETGTANGGSALMWASMMELTRPGSGKVITIDPVNPAEAQWAGNRIRDPRGHPLWTKYVTFLMGSSTDDSVLFRVRSAAGAASRVLVLLDSHHTEAHVEGELRNYCPLVSEGSYCIVQDTKLSRFGLVGGPAPAIRSFLASTSDFAVDRDREPFYTQHVGGYLKRVKGSFTSPGEH